MFFDVNEELLRRLAERFQQAQGQAKPKSGQDTGPKIYRASDGAIVIDDPSVVKVISVTDGLPGKEDLDRTSFWTNSYGWVPISCHPVFGEGSAPEGPSVSVSGDGRHSHTVRTEN